MSVIKKVEKFEINGELFDSEEEAALDAAFRLIKGDFNFTTTEASIIKTNLKTHYREILTFLQKVKN